MQKSVIFLGLAMSLVACNKVSFQPTPETNQKMEVIDPVEPPPPTTTTTNPLPQPLRKTGACSDQQIVTSCLKCEVPAMPPPPPVISTKAQKLAKIMSMACQIPNKSYPKGYVAPTASQVEAHLLTCTPELYPETVMAPAQSDTIGKLLDEQNTSLREKMFKGLWYQPPYTEHFETYFGLDNSEAAYVICMNQGALSPVLMTKEYADAVGTDGGLERWQSDPQAQARWQAAQKQRQQLLSCFNKPGTAVAVTPAPSPAPQVCEYKTFEGLYELGGREEILNALAEGYKVSLESPNSCVMIRSSSDVANLSGLVKIGAYRCH